MLLAICLYVEHTASRRRGKHWKKWGPTYLCILASMLIMMDQSRHILQDMGYWPPPSSSQYRQGCEDESMACLSAVGWIFTFFATYLGFAILFVGTLWNGNICQKLKEIKEKWKQLRSGNDSNEMAHN